MDKEANDMRTKRESTGIFMLALLGSFLIAGVSIAQNTEDVPPPRLVCASEPGERQHCPADTSAGVALVRETGTTPCILGNNWGYDAHGVWVSDGCSAEFTLGRADSGKLDDFLGKFDPYGRFLAHVAIFDDEAVVQDNASWLGMRFSTGEGIRFFAGVEFGVNIIGGPQLNPGASTESGFLTVEQVEPQVFGNRLGYLGVDFGPGGYFTLGKQKSVHYDIAGYTSDRWNVFGGQASLAYPAGSDGGTTGTGRINQALTYRNTVLKILEFGLQTQFRNVDNSKFFDGFGASAQVTVLPGFKLAASYTKTLLSEFVEEGFRGLGGDAKYVGFGARFDSPLFEIGLVVADQTNGDVVRRPLVIPGAQIEEIIPIVFDGTGVEIYAKVKLGAFSILGGFINYDTDNIDPLIANDFRTRYGILGAEVYLGGTGYLYAEARLDDSIDADGQDQSSILAVGFKYEFSWKSLHLP
jgi:predicted porin